LGGLRTCQGVSRSKSGIGSLGVVVEGTVVVEVVVGGNVDVVVAVEVDEFRVVDVVDVV
jgi:hypothetical protein